MGYDPDKMKKVRPIRYNFTEHLRQKMDKDRKRFKELDEKFWNEEDKQK